MSSLVSCLEKMPNYLKIPMWHLPFCEAMVGDRLSRLSWILCTSANPQMQEMGFVVVCGFSELVQDKVVVRPLGVVTCKSWKLRILDPWFGIQCVFFPTFKRLKLKSLGFQSARPTLHGFNSGFCIVMLSTSSSRVRWRRRRCPVGKFQEVYRVRLHWSEKDEASKQWEITWNRATTFFYQSFMFVVSCGVTCNMTFFHSLFWIVWIGFYRYMMYMIWAPGLGYFRNHCG